MVMKGEKSKIIVFQAFDTTIQANLVKTKLDAYGIPCFLTDESFVNLYPIRNEIFPGVRLHIFENDIARVSEILSENIAHKREEAIQCPLCKSNQVHLVNSRKSWFAWLMTSILFVFMPQKRVFRCQVCDNEFDYVDT